MCCAINSLLLRLMSLKENKIFLHTGLPKPSQVGSLLSGGQARARWLTHKLCATPKKPNSLKSFLRFTKIVRPSERISFLTAVGLLCHAWCHQNNFITLLRLKHLKEDQSNIAVCSIASKLMPEWCASFTVFPHKEPCCSTLCHDLQLAGSKWQFYSSATEAIFKQYTFLPIHCQVHLSLSLLLQMFWPHVRQLDLLCPILRSQPFAFRFTALHAYGDELCPCGFWNTYNQYDAVFFDNCLVISCQFDKVERCEEHFAFLVKIIVA